MKLNIILRRNREIVSYALIGIFTTGVGYGLFYLLHYPLRQEINFSNTLSVIGAVIFAYVTNKLVVFRTKCGSLLSLLREMSAFASSRVFAMLVEIGGVFLLGTLAGLDGMVSKLIVSAAVVALNYFLSKVFVFKSFSGKNTKSGTGVNRGD